ncbi:PfkB family carbohydrate kinase [Leucobacter ruminantium]|uniref:Bifunctional heptose 7-phosphate kinase/heptose 1-phosphate adenyltransferase n=1 Tax=Leucobacter ruminantium TaxID=1289170 RepID=A0A939LT12_9MICO|nr:PfkB family carbohydrate kinase [Leucobacter ruminantium]MBO1804310.1 bifunctional heptose 7-phosphate kinase/heptose 1-phosphate adenyltransferase [Leucobacter ruminantium]
MRITIVGDVLLDEDIDGTATKFYPDAAAPVVEVTSRNSRAGGAGLVAGMLEADGHEVVLVTALSDDAGGARLREHLADVDLVACPSDAPTPVKSRLRAEGHPVCRIDEGCEEAPAPRVGAHTIAAIEAAEALVVADYGRGLAAHPAVREALRRRGREVPLVWDPHPRGAEPVASAALVTPNLAEAAAAAGTPPDPAAAGDAAARLLERYGCGAVAVTLGAHGALLLEERGDALLVPAAAAETGDPCGAGDRFAASAAVALARGEGHEAAVRTAVADAAAYLARGGVASLGRLQGDRTVGVEVAEAEQRRGTRSLVESVRDRGGTVVAAGGCFDLLHAGHVRTLEAARALGDCLIVLLNSDASVRRLKGPTRPIIGQDDRVEMLRALACVDDVIVFEEDGPEAALDALRPDLWVKGGDYRVESLPETRLLESWGGRAVALPYHLGRSTTHLAEALAQVG